MLVGCFFVTWSIERHLLLFVVGCLLVQPIVVVLSIVGLVDYSTLKSNVEQSAYLSVARYALGANKSLEVGVGGSG